MKIGNWNGTMDCEWDRLSVLAKDTIHKFSDEILKYPQCAPSDKVGVLITKKSITRFINISDVFTAEIKDGLYYQLEDVFDNVQNGRLINSWILLGSLTEVSIQIFLTIYILDYENSSWQQWKNFNQDEVKKCLFATLNNLVQNGTLTSEQSTTFKNAIKSKIREHTVEHPVEKVMLDELIQFCEQQNLFDDDTIWYLRLIQQNRNAIHAYMDRTIGTWNDLQYATRFFVAFLNEMMFRLPELPDDIFL